MEQDFLFQADSPEQAVEQMLLLGETRQVAQTIYTRTAPGALAV